MSARAHIVRARRIAHVTRVLVPILARWAVQIARAYRTAWTLREVPPPRVESEVWADAVRSRRTAIVPQPPTVENVYDAARRVTSFLETYGGGQWGLKREGGSGIVPLAEEHANMLLELRDRTNDVLRERRW